MQSEIKNQLEQRVKEVIAYTYEDEINNAALGVFEQLRGVISMSFNAAFEKIEKETGTTVIPKYNYFTDAQVFEYYYNGPINDDNLLVNGENNDSPTEHRNTGSGIDNIDNNMIESGIDTYYATVVRNHMGLTLAHTDINDNRYNTDDDNLDDNERFSAALSAVDRSNDMHELKLNPVFNVFDDDTANDNAQEKLQRYFSLLRRGTVNDDNKNTIIKFLNKDHD